MVEYNVYCDESCHLEHDDSSAMFLGAITCPKSDVRKYLKDIKRIKEKHGLNSSYEFKWTKVSQGALPFYEEIIEYFFQSEMGFRCVIANGKKELSNEIFNQTYDEWYYKMYYLLLSKMLDTENMYYVYADIKDTNGGRKVKKLQEIINNFLYCFSSECLKRVQLVRSDEISLIQLADLLIGTVAYTNRFLADFNPPENVSKAKIKLCKYVMYLSGGFSLTQSTSKDEKKFNIFAWEPRKLW